MDNLKKVFSLNLSVLGQEIAGGTYQQTMLSDGEYQAMYATGNKQSQYLAYGASVLSSVSPTSSTGLFGSYFLCFDEDLNIRAEESQNINWKNLNKSKTEIIKECLKYFLREEYSEELFSMFLLKFGF